jgi:hypothetical protein
MPSQQGHIVCAVETRVLNATQEATNATVVHVTDIAAGKITELHKAMRTKLLLLQF